MESKKALDELFRMCNMINSRDREMQNLGLVIMYPYADIEKLIQNRDSFILQARIALARIAYLENIDPIKHHSLIWSNEVIEKINI